MGDRWKALWRTAPFVLFSAANSVIGQQDCLGIHILITRKYSSGSTNTRLNFFPTMGRHGVEMLSEAAFFSAPDFRFYQIAYLGVISNTSKIQPVPAAVSCEVA
jgi:hypothetical protein